MKKHLLSIMLAFGLVNTNAQVQIVISPADEIILPQYAHNGFSNATRVPTVCRLKLTGLVANATYRYTVGMSARDTFITGTAPGHLISIKNELDTTGQYLGLPSPGYINGLATFKSLAGNTIQGDRSFEGGNPYFVSLKTDVNGEYVGWFATVPNHSTTTPAASVHLPHDANAYFYVHLSVANPTTPVSNLPDRTYRTTNTIKVASYYNPGANIFNGVSPVVGVGGSVVGSEKIVCLYDNTAKTGRPISTSFTENDGLRQDTIYDGTNSWYGTRVNGTVGNFATIMPNINPNGIRGLAFYNIPDASIINTGRADTSSRGIWNNDTTYNPKFIVSVITTINAETLPVKLTSFQGKQVNSSVHLNWSTAQEINNSYFEVLKSTNGNNYYALEKVNGNNNSNIENKYNFKDNNPAIGLNYYVLKQVDHNGKFELSKTVTINYKKNAKSEMSVLSNNSNEIKLSLVLTDDVKGSIRLTDMEGKVLYQNNRSFVKGENFISLPVNNSGKILIAQFIGTSENISLKILRN